ncbi:ATP-binding cassette, subfamily F, uup [Peptoclostridium litorale DSM 5388]|uniref:ABC transporter ATP-binding protein n=1 Tax=Peptoclostridium litorale DSM 5388 TaxID=1121324 RepID=A0A069RQI7_PEPLI|nr:ABC-F family ATP-binding cassette domain-containing protein [Peptoclostridium litorale]KDR96437.1 ABC transporter ATP-binding protein [Peptoclostridium litorale DSM 5388]SIN70597.1 ATP-binding cassette, subfamily F, uup [Peptoclostridium litorale DSM 5388]
MIVLTAENLSKSYGEKILFKDISLTIASEDKIGLIGVNGTGKSSLLKSLSGKDPADSGNVNIPSSVRVEYLFQNPDFEECSTVLEHIFSRGDSPEIKLIRDYEKILSDMGKHPEDESLQKRLLKLTADMDSLDVWELESQVKTILTKLGITDFDQKISTLSGGQKKRVALSTVLIHPCDLLILDEPTNHMDSDTIAWLEEYLKNRKGALIMITHDRYFLDRVVNKTVELDSGNIYTYSGGYSQFIQKKAERKNLESSMERKRERLYKKELEWIRTGAKARTTKQKARIQRFETLEDSKMDINDEKVEISVAHSRLGSKIVEIESISKSFTQAPLIKDFTYTILKNDRIGIVGDNGTGKSTLLNMISGKIQPDSGLIDVGSTVNMGYFSQESEDMDTSMRAIEYIRSHAEYITTADGTKISASQMMERFLFTGDMQWTFISRLSGGERRRLYLLKVLMDSPNVLILDEPTNDLDIETLTVLEDYIDEFAGPVITVSHDRYFLDRVCRKIISFDGCGAVSVHHGNYSDFSEKANDALLNSVSGDQKQNTDEKQSQKPKKQKNKLSYKEQQEYDNIGSEIEDIESNIEQVDIEISKYSTEFTKLQNAMERKEELEILLLEKLERQEYLEELKTSLE